MIKYHIQYFLYKTIDLFLVLCLFEKVTFYYLLFLLENKNLMHLHTGAKFALFLF